MSEPAVVAPPAPDLLLLLIRHAEQRSMQVADAELSDRGEAQAALLAERLAALPITSVVSSHLRRAVQTAAAVARACQLEPEIEPDLEEVRIDDHARRRRYQLSAGRAMEPDPDDYTSAALAMVRMATRTRWGADPGSESGDQLRARTVAAAERVIAAHAGGVVACVAHGGTINSILGSWTGIARDLWFVPWHTGISAVLVHGDQRILLSVNDATHLARDQDLLHVVAGGLAPVEGRRPGS